MPTPVSTPESGKYEVLRPLGRGGMGEVYLARDKRLGREVAIKYLRRDLASEQWREQLHREAKLLAQLNHPNIVQVYDLVEQQENLALVMEYVPGNNLHVELRERRVELAQKLLWLTQIAEGLAASHRAGICHCDLKAENVLLGPDRVAKVTDFGIATLEPDAGGDVLALGKLAEKMLGDDAGLSPLQSYLLQRLNASDPRQRPDSATAARELREAWHESTQGETPLPQELTATVPTRPWQRPIAAVALATMVALAGLGIWWLRPGPELEYVAILPTSVQGGELLAAEQSERLTTTVQQALQESVIASPGLALISADDTAAVQGSLAEKASALGAGSMLVSRLQCRASACELVLQRVDGGNGAVAAQRNLKLLPDTPLETHDSIQRQWHRLYSSVAPLAGVTGLISEADYSRYLQLRQGLDNNQLSHRQVLPQLEELLLRADRFLPLYHFYAQVALVDFRLMGDANSLQRLDALLTKAELWAGESLYLARSRFNLAIELGDEAAARKAMEQMARVGADELLLTNARGELQYQLGHFDKAARHYERAVALRPTAANMYAAARNYFFWGRAEEALSASEALLLRYPYYVPAFNVKGTVLLGQGKLDQAIAAYEESLSLQPDDPLMRANLSLIYLMKGDYASSREQLLISYRDNSRDPVLVLNLADTESLLGNHERARELYSELVDRGEREHMVVAPWVMSQAYAQLGQFEQALATLKEIKNQQQDSPESAFSAALVYTLAGQDIAALVEVDRALAGGMSPIWFDFPWFDGLCTQSRFQELLTGAGHSDRCLGKASSKP